MNVVAVGHTKEKFLRLLSMVPEGWNVFKVFNGKEYIEGGVIHCPNCPTGRDIKMYHLVISSLSPERWVCINDDVEHLSKEFWDTAKTYCSTRYPFDIVGVANLASWADHTQLGEPQKKLAEAQGKDPLFVRTSAFMCTREHFLKCWEKCGGDAQAFEKSTLKESTNSMLIPAAWAYDSNISPYVTNQVG